MFLLGINRLNKKCLEMFLPSSEVGLSVKWNPHENCQMAGHKQMESWSGARKGQETAPDSLWEVHKNGVFFFLCMCRTCSHIYIYTPTVLRWWLTAIIQNRHTKEVLLGTNLNTIFMVRYYLTVALFVLKKYIWVRKKKGGVPKV